MNLNQTTCLITGASGGIGWAIAHALHAQGAQLVLSGRKMRKLQCLNQQLGGGHRCLAADIGSEEGRQIIVDAVVSDPAINLVIQAAGVSAFGEFSRMQPAAVEAGIALNLTAPMLIAHGVLPALAQRSQATLVNVGSAFGYIGFPCFSTYCASKFGLRGFTEALQREYASSDVRIVYFAPRATRTPFNSAAVDDMNYALGNRTDGPETVANALLRVLRRGHRRGVVGWPEKLICRLNGVLPELVDKALASKLKTILQTARQQQTEENRYEALSDRIDDSTGDNAVSPDTGSVTVTGNTAVLGQSQLPTAGRRTGQGFRGADRHH